MRKCLWLLPLVVWLSGCVTPARRLDATVVDQVHEGVATRAEIEKLLGRPRSFETGSGGKSVAVYEFVERKENVLLPLGKSELRARRLSLLYSASFVLEKKLLSSSISRIKTGWREKLGHPLSREEIIRTMQRPVTRAELIEKLGPPTVESLTFDGGMVAGWLALEQASAWWGGIDRQVFEVVFDEAGVAKDYHIVGTLDPRTAPAKR